MKKILLMVMLLGGLHTTRAQEEIIYDFKTKTTPTLDEEKMTPGAYYVLVIRNINQNLYKITLTASDTVLSKALEPPTLGSLELDAVSKAIAGISSLSTTLAGTGTFGLFMEGMRAELKGMSPLPKAAGPPIVTRMNEAKKDLEQADRKMTALAHRLDSIKLKIYKARLEALDTDGADSSFNYEQALKEMEDIRAGIASLWREIAASGTEYKDFAAKHRTVITEEELLASTDERIKNAYEKLMTALKAAQETLSADKVYELIASVLFLENNTGNEYRSLPFQFKEEQAKLQLVIAPRDEKYLLQTYTTAVSFPLQRKPYAVVGLSFYGATLHDEAFSTIKTPQDDSVAVYSITKEEVTNAEIGVTALVRYGIKLNKRNNAGVHASLGPGVSLSSSTIRPRVLLGGGFSFGRTHMAALDFGAIAGTVDRLSSGADVNATSKEKPENVTVSRLRAGAFLSLGYIYKF